MTQASIHSPLVQAHALDTSNDPWLAPGAPFEVTLKDVRYAWNDRDIWHIDTRIDFRKLRGRVPVVGRSGNGKTTLLYVITGLKWPLDGTITWRLPDGREWSWGKSGVLSGDDDWPAFRRRIGFAFQDSTLLPHLTVAENLRYPLMLDGVSRGTAEEKARTILDRMIIHYEREDDRHAVDKMLRKFPKELSGGQRKRAALAQAMMRNPDVLFADEPAGSLDYRTAAEVRLCVLNWLNKCPGQHAFVWVTHHRTDPAEYGAEFEIEPPAANSPNPPNRLIPLPVKPKPSMDVQQFSLCHQFRLIFRCCNSLTHSVRPIFRILSDHNWERIRSEIRNKTPKQNAKMRIADGCPGMRGYAILWLAGREYWRAWFRPPGSNRDLLWLTALIGAITGLALLMSSANDGLLKLYADSLLGYVAGHGLPIMVRAEIGRGPEIDNAIMTENRLHPFVEVGANARLAPILQPRFGNSESIDRVADDWISRFVGWAVYPDDPLYRWSLQQAHAAPDRQAFPLRIVLAQHALKDFDYVKYQQAVLSEVPEPVARPTFKERVQDLEVMWLKFPRIGPVKASVVPVPNLPSPVPLAFLLPMPTLHLAEAVHHLPNLMGFPVESGETERIDGVRLFAPDGDYTVAESFTPKLAACLQPMDPQFNGYHIHFKRPPPFAWVRQCGQAIGLPAKIELRPETVETDTVSIDPGDPTMLRIPCNRLGLKTLADPRNAACGQAEGILADGDFHALISGYTGGMYYTENPDDITALRNHLLSVANNRNQTLFHLDPAYEMSLEREQHLSGVTNLTIRGVKIASITFAIYLLVHSIGLTIGHRAEYYGTLMANGVTIRALHSLLQAEVVIAWAVGGACVGLLLELVKAGINAWFATTTLALQGRELLAITRTDILPVSSLATFMTILAGTLLTSVVVTLLLAGRRLPRNNEAAKLMHT